MADARITIGVSGESDVARTLSAVEQQQQRIVAAGQSALQETLRLAESDIGQVDPVRSRADLGRLRAYERDQVQQNRDLNKDAPERRLQFADRRADIEARYQARQEEALTKAAAMDGKFQAKGVNAPIVDKWLATQEQQIEQEHEKDLQELTKEQEEYEQTLREANDGLGEFRDHIKEIVELAGRFQRGDTLTDEERPSTRQLGLLEELRLDEQHLKSQLERATTGDEQKDIRSRLQDTQKRIDEATGGTDTTSGQRHLADKVSNSMRQAFLASAGAIGGTMGQLASGAVAVASQAKEMFTLDIPKILGAGIATAGVAAATAVGLLVPKGKELEGAQNRLAGITGIKAGDFDFGTTRKAGGLYGGQQPLSELLAVNLAEFRDAARELAISSGSARNLEKRTMDNLVYSRALGVDQSVLNSLGSESYRLQGGGNMERNVAQMLSIFQRSGIINISDKGQFDSSRLAESIGRVQSLNDAQKSRFGQASTAKSASLVAAGEALGGMFRGSTGNQMLLGLDAAIRNPGNDYTQAFAYRALQRPGDSLYTLQKRQQQGIFDGGENYARIFDLLSKKHGGKRDELFMMDLAAETNLTDNFAAVERLAKGGRNALKGVSSEKDFMAKYGSQAFEGKAIEQTGDLSKIETMVVNKMQVMGVGAKDGLVEVAEMMGIHIKPGQAFTAEQARTADMGTQLKRQGDIGEKQLEQQRQMNRQLEMIHRQGLRRAVSPAEQAAALNRGNRTR